MRPASVILTAVSAAVFVPILATPASADDDSPLCVELEQQTVGPYYLPPPGFWQPVGPYTTPYQKVCVL